MKKIVGLLLFVMVYHTSLAQDKFTISGYIRDAQNGESLIGATVLIKELGTGVVSNVYGFYSITLPSDTYEVEYSYIGYSSQIKQLSLVENIKLDIELSSSLQQLNEVIISGEAEDENVSSMEMSTNKLDIETIKKIPAFMGEVDVLKSIQLLPGVSTVGEGAAGFNVRGGGVGQNLVLLDEAPVYNPSHLFGFFSVFNPDAVKDTKLYKGAIPAQFGGRISSLLDVRMKEGNNKELSASGGIGTVFSRLAIEAPIIKNKSSFIVAARRSYIDVLAKPFVEELKNTGLSFYDLTLKTNYNLNDNNQLYLSGYFGRDVFKFDANQGFNWGSKTATLRWNHLFSDKLFSNFTLVYSKYDYQLAFGEDENDFFKWDSNVTNYIFKPSFTYYLNKSHEISFGGAMIYYQFEPANAAVGSGGDVINLSLGKKYNLESAVYINNNQKISNTFSVEYGLRFSSFQQLGAGTSYQYENPVIGESKVVTGFETFDKNEIIASYSNFEPRLSFKYQPNSKNSIKGSYNRMSQYIHLISNTTASNPLDVWTASSNNIAPQLGDQFTLGYFRNFSNNDFETSVEVYARNTQNQIDYIDGAEILINEQLEADLLSGIGRAYGVELFVKKNSGKLNGWISYTLGKTELKVEGINNDDWYPTKFDQTHNLKIVGFYDLNKRVSISTNFSFVTGTPTTFPTSRFMMQGVLVPHNSYNSRNNIRLPNYHRLDLSVRIDGKKVKKGKPRKVEDYFSVGVYNLYANRNAFSIYFSQSEGRFQPNQPIPSQATKVSIIGTVIPSISYNFKF